MKALMYHTEVWDAVLISLKCLYTHSPLLYKMNEIKRRPDSFRHYRLEA